jgi:hypothetical protein
VGGGGYHTVRRPSEMDPTNFNVETVLEAMAGGLINLSWQCNSKGVQDINRRSPRELDIDVVARLRTVQ